MSTWILYLVWVWFTGSTMSYSLTDIADGFTTQANCVRGGLNVTSQLTFGNPRYPEMNATFLCIEEVPAKP